MQRVRWRWDLSDFGLESAAWCYLRYFLIFSTGKPSSIEKILYFSSSLNKSKDESGEWLGTVSEIKWDGNLWRVRVRLDNCKDSGQWLKATEVSPVKTSKKSKK